MGVYLFNSGVLRSPAYLLGGSARTDDNAVDVLIAVLQTNRHCLKAHYRS